LNAATVRALESEVRVAADGSVDLVWWNGTIVRLGQVDLSDLTDVPRQLGKLIDGADVTVGADGSVTVTV
jgi:hypothetical protein